MKFSLKVFFAVLICKILYFIGSLIGRGSSLPGQVALGVCPGALGKLKLPETVIAVTGSNGKTSTTEFLAQALTKCGMRVGWNHEGSNQIEGVATLLFRIADFRGIVKRDALVFESDERFARQIFKAIKPSVIVVTNLCRDQLTRNGHPEFIQDCLRKAITAARDARRGGVHRKLPCLVLNADDPYVAALGAANGKWSTEYGKSGEIDREIQDSEPVDVIWFGVGRGVAHNSLSSAAPLSPAAGSPGDCVFCPTCKARMSYDYRITGHFGAYHCGVCGLSRPKPEFEVTALDMETGKVIINPDPELYAGVPSQSGVITTHLALPGLTGAYNLVATVAAARAVGIDPGGAARALDKYGLLNGRAAHFNVGGRDGMLLISKHENSMSYNQSLSWIAGRGKPCTVLILVDSISRKYYTSETSWLWDVDFDILAAESVKDLALAGRYSNELMARFAMSSVTPEKFRRVESLDALRQYAMRCDTDELYAITCFSDRAKLLKAFR